ncbi:MAG: PAS domain-containing protein [bacterium]|nr:PAS domain-containing protein [bacterium]
MDDTAASENLAASILNSLNSRIAVIDGGGTIRVVNDAWANFARDNGDPDLCATGIGVNYLEATRRAHALGDASAERALAGIEAVIQRARPQFELKYPCHSPTEEKWFLMRVTPLRGDTPGAVIAHIDITGQQAAARTAARTAARAGRRRALAHDQARRSEREQAALDHFTHANGVVYDTVRAEDSLIDRYQALIDAALERRALKVAHDVSGEARRFAQALGRQSASPRDLIRIHTQAMVRQQAGKPTPARLRALGEEGRLLLLEVMGYLAAYYRDLFLADVELQNL